MSEPEASSLWYRAGQAVGAVAVVVDRAGRIVECDAPFAARCGHPPSELIGRHAGLWLDALAPPRLPELWAALDRRSRITFESAFMGSPAGHLLARAAAFEAEDERRCVAIFGALEPVPDEGLHFEQDTLEAMLTAVGNAVFDWDLATHRLVISAAGQRLFRLDGAEHPDGRALFNRMIHPDDLAAVDVELKRLVTGAAETLQSELRIVDDTGPRANVLVCARIAGRDPDGRARHVIGSLVEVTARRRVEESLRRERDLLDAVISTGVTALIVQDTAGRLVYANPEAARMLGYPTRAAMLSALRRPEEWSFTRVDGAPCPLSGHPYARVIDLDDTITGAEYGLEAVDGRTLTLSIKSAPTRNAAGVITRIVSTLDDITRRRAAEVALRASERMLRGVLDRLPVAVALVTADGRVASSNPAASAMLGQPGASLVGRDLFAAPLPLLDESGDPVTFPHHPFFSPWISGQPVHDMTLVARLREEGPLRWVLASAVPRLSPAGEVLDVVTGFTDITPRKHIELSLMQVQKTEGIGRLASGIAHDFNNLLTAVMCGAQLVRFDLEPDHPAQEEIEAILGAAERGADLTRQLLAYARKQPFTPRVVDIGELVGRAAAMLERLLGEDIRLTVDARTDIRASLDPGQFDQVLVNLTVNARDAMPAGGDLRIEVDVHPRLDHDAPLGGEAAVLRVRDTGTGIPGELLPQIFDPFFSTKSTGEGTGLGLAVVYGIVRQNGGQVHVTSEPGRGTTFEVVFPRVRDQLDRPPTIAAPAPIASHGRLLLVEDDPAVRESARRALTRAGFSVVAAADGGEALKAIADLEADAAIEGVITDVVMPVLGGHSLARALAERSPGIPILFTSGHTDGRLVDHGVVRGRVDFLPKPYSPDGLCRRVRLMLGREPGDPR